MISKMNSENLKQWLDLTRKYQQQHFWQQMFDPQSFTQEKKDQFEKTFNGLKVEFPACDMYQKDEFLYLEIELPGVSMEDIRITLQQKSLVIKGKYHTIKPSMQYFLKERISKTFEKEIPLPYAVASKKIRHYFQHGLLRISIPIINNSDEEVPVHISVVEPKTNK